MKTYKNNFKLGERIYIYIYSKYEYIFSIIYLSKIIYLSLENFDITYISLKT